MTPVPVVCDNCHRLWITESMFAVTGGGVIAAEMENVSVRPCPYCDGTGHVPDGVWELGTDTARLLSALRPDDLRALLRVVTQAQKENLDAEEVVERIEKEVPAAAGIRDFILGSRGAPVVALLSLLVAIIGVVLPQVQGQSKPLTQEQTTRAFVQALEQVKREAPPITKSRPKIGRNDPCWCGSGKKFKKCHGR